MTTPDTPHAAPRRLPALLLAWAAFTIFAAMAPAAMAPNAMAMEPAGLVTRVQGEAVAVAPGSGASRALAPDSALYSGDRLETGPGARLEARFVDGTVLTLSEETTLTVDTYVYDKGLDVGGALLDLTKGAFRAVTGDIAKSPDPWFQVKTPLAAIGIRGTDFWGGWLGADGFGVLMISGDKKVVVSNPAGSVELGPGQGTTVDAPGAAPTPVKTWPAGKVARAVATVTFD